MKSMVIGAAIAALIATPALSADLAVKAPTPLPPPVPVLNSTGCYANAGAGYGMYNQDHQTIDDGITFGQDQTAGGRGWLGLVGVGCDYQFSMGSWGNWVVGAFGDYDFMDLQGNLSPDVGYLTGSEKENWAWAVGGRIGYLVTPAILAYWNGGFTSTRFGSVNLSTTEVIGVSPESATLGAQTFDGGFIGGGTEIAVQWWPGLFWRSEYRYSSYRSENVQFFQGGIPVPGAFEHENKNVQTITSSLVWKFNWTGH
jgi:outer membrane immunogenic protein